MRKSVCLYMHCAQGPYIYICRYIDSPENKYKRSIWDIFYPRHPTTELWQPCCVTDNAWLFRCGPALVWVLAASIKGMRYRAQPRAVKDSLPSLPCMLATFSAKSVVVHTRGLSFGQGVSYSSLYSIKHLLEHAVVCKTFLFSMFWKDRCFFKRFVFIVSTWKRYLVAEKDKARN